MVPQPYIQLKKRKNNLVSLLISLAVVGALVGLGFISINEYRSTPKSYEGTQLNLSDEMSYSFSTDQQRILDEHGLPDSFSILFYEEELDPQYEGDVRDEIWRYYGDEVYFVFYNGALIDQDGIPNAPDSWLPVQYNPDQFTAYASLESVLASGTIRDFFELPLEKNLIKDGVLYYAPGIMFGTVDNRLVYIETLSMEVVGGQND